MHIGYEINILLMLIVWESLGNALKQARLALQRCLCIYDAHVNYKCWVAREHLCVKLTNSLLHMVPTYCIPRTEQHVRVTEQLYRLNNIRQQFKQKNITFTLKNYSYETWTFMK